MSVTGGDGAQPPEGNGRPPAEPGQGPEERPEKPAAKPDGGVSRMRVVGYALLVVAVLAALVPILGLAAEAPSSPQRQAAESSRVAEQTTTRKTTTTKKPSQTTKKKKTSTKPKSSRKKTSEPAVVGPKINSDSNEQADTMLTRRKLVVGGIALGLLVIVIWGRRARNVRRKKMDTQSKGGK